MAAASPSTVTYAVGCGEYISIDSVRDDPGMMAVDVAAKAVI